MGRLGSGGNDAIQYYADMTSPDDNQPDEYGLTKDRMTYILSLVKKKANAALNGRTGNHFLVYPPPEYLERPDLSSPDVYQRFKNTVWWVRWYDDHYDQLSFFELVLFVFQIIEAQRAFQQAAKAVHHPSRHQGSKHSGGWQPKKDRSKKPKRKQDVEERVEVKVTGSFSPADLAKDEMIRALFSKVAVESTTRPNQALN